MNIDEDIIKTMSSTCIENVVNVGRFIKDVVYCKGDISRVMAISPDYLLICEKCDDMFPVFTESMIGPIAITNDSSVLSTIHSLILSRSNGRRNEQHGTEVLMFDIYGFTGCMYDIYDLFTTGEGSTWLSQQSEVYREQMDEYLGSIRKFREYVNREIARIDLSNSLADDLDSLLSKL